MARAQTGISSLPQKNNLIVSFKVQDIPLGAMSIGHVAANIPGLANEFRKSSPGSDLLYTIGFGPQLWNFTWQGNLPPGFLPLETEENEDDDDSGPDLIFCFSASQPEILHELAEQSQIHLKNIADVDEMIMGTPVGSPANSQLSNEETAAGALIGNKHPEYFQSSFLFALRLTHTKQRGNKSSLAEQENLSGRLHTDFISLTENESGLINHLYIWKTEIESGYYLLAFCDHVQPFLDILDRLTAPSADSLEASWKDIKISPSIFFLPSLEILAGLRMGTLRMGPLSPTARWK